MNLLCILYYPGSYSRQIYQAYISYNLYTKTVKQIVANHSTKALWIFLSILIHKNAFKINLRNKEIPHQNLFLLKTRFFYRIMHFYINHDHINFDNVNINRTPQHFTSTTVADKRIYWNKMKGQMNFFFFSLLLILREKGIFSG